MDKIKYIFNVYRKECIVGLVFLICLAFIAGGSYYVYAKENDDAKYLADSTEMSLKEVNEEIEFDESNKEQKSLETEKKEDKEKIRVDIKGEVISPGVYEASNKDRVIDIINYAGGLKDSADTSVNNLSRRVWDEMVIIIYSKEEVENFTATKETEMNEILESEEINNIILNDATLKEEDILTNQDNYNTHETEEKKTPDSSKNPAKTELTSKISINTAPVEELMKLTGIGKAKAEAIITYRNTNGNFTVLEDLMKVKGIGEKVFAKIKDNITL